MIQKIKGFQYRVKINFEAFGFNDCSDIEIVLTNPKDDLKYTFKKVPASGEYPVENSSGENLNCDILLTKEMTNELMTGDIYCEIKRTVISSDNGVIKNRVKLFNLIDSYTS